MLIVIWVSISEARMLTFRAGDSLQRLLESASKYVGRPAVRRLLPELGPGRRRTLSTEQRHHRDQTSQQHVHVSRQSRSQTHLPRLQVRTLVHGRIQRRSLTVGCVAQWLERWSLTGELSLSHRPTLDLQLTGDHLCG